MEASEIILLCFVVCVVTMIFCALCHRDNTQGERDLLRSENQRLKAQPQAPESTTQEIKHPKNVRYIASPNRKKFHYPQCKWVQALEGKSVLGFKSRKQALAAGLKRCYTCKS